MYRTKLFIITFLFLSVNLIFAFSGHITENTTWSDDIIITGDTWIDEGATLTINAGVTISFPKVDANEDDIGDIDFIINGRLLTQGTPGNEVIFTSLEVDPQPDDWSGIDYLHLLSQNSNLQYTNVLFAHQGIHINGKLFTLNYGTIQECGDYGIRVENSHSLTTSLNNVTIFENTTYGLKVETNGIINGTGILISSNGSHGFWLNGTSNATFTNSRSVSNDGNGVYIESASPSFSNTFINSNGMCGVKVEGASSDPDFDQCSVENNDEFGFYFRDGSTGLIEYSEIIDNLEFGIYVTDNSLPTFNYCNIHDNSSNSTVITESIPSGSLYLNYEGYSSYYSILFPVNKINQIHVSGYGDHDSSSDDYYFFVYAGGGSTIYSFSQVNTSYDTNFDTWANISSSAASNQLRVQLDIYSIYSYWGRVSEILYDPIQGQFVLGNTTGILDAGHNWWGQITGVDDLIVQSIPGTIDYSTMETEPVASAGASYTNIEPQFTLNTPDTMLVNPANVTFNWIDMDVDDDAQISFYYDDGLDETGILITEGISEDSSTDSYLWNLSGVPYALYYVYGVIDDGVNTPVVSYATGQVMVGPVSVSAPDDSHGAANGQVTIPINVANTYDYFGIISFQFILNFDNILMTANSVETTGTLTESWSVDSNLTIPGQITVNGFSTDTLSTGGTLLNIVFDILPGVADYSNCIINISTFEFNDGDVEVEIDDGLFTVLNEYIISGNIDYYANAEPVQSVDMILTGTENDSVSSDVLGEYIFPVHIAGNYELAPSSDLEIPELVITPYDASLVARYALSLETFSNEQIIAGDVNDNLETTVYDAALIAQYSVDLIDEFDAGIWKFSPTSFAFELTGVDEVADFAAIAIGDPSGNWSAAREDNENIWDVPSLISRDGEQIHLNLTYDNEF
ncbi:MAG: right-handed parallel beta-helix repeat-containing protein, partial [Candidatus Cloacimonetes bacterium]|nr:right-handed parallel beta-helix repeat-containing protein [Candidatus Cloacimonadota bacterium]